jgi:hypothetical protein
MDSVDLQLVRGLLNREEPMFRNGLHDVCKNFTL